MANALEEALEFEAKESVDSIKDMMDMMLQNVQEAGEHVRDIDEITVRRMLLARHYILKDIDKMKDMKKAIVNDWDRRIKSKEEEVQKIESIVDYFIREKNGGKTLSLDIATSSLRRVNHKIKVTDEEKVEAYLKEKDILDHFLKKQIDKTKVQTYMLNQFSTSIQPIIDQRIEEEKEMNNGKITKKRMGEIELEVIEEQLPKFNETLPEGFELEMPKKVLNIRSNIK